MPGMATEQPRQPVLRKPLAPAADKRIVAVELVANLRPAMTRLQQQDQPRSAPVVCPTAAARRPLVQLRLFCFCQCDPVLHEHDLTTFLRVTRHYYACLVNQIQPIVPVFSSVTTYTVVHEQDRCPGVVMARRCGVQYRRPVG